MRRYVAIVSIAVMIVAGAAATDPARAATRDPRQPIPQLGEKLPYQEVVPSPPPAIAPPAGGLRVAHDWPAAARADVTLGRSLARASTLPISLSGKGEPAKAHVALADRARTAKAGVTGVLFAIDGGASSATVDYSSFANAGGANFGQRLRLVQLPACALTTPDVAACRVQQPLKSTNDAATQTVHTDALSSGATVLAATAGPSGSNGDFGATSLSPSDSWSVSGSSGSFAWSYPITSPPAAADSDVVPDVALSYNSGSIDGRTSTTNNQSSWVGEGWDYSPGYIERTYRPCAEDTTLPTESQTPDLCWAGDIVTIRFGGKSTELVRDDATGTWHPSDDDGEKVELLTGASNGDDNGEYWRITDTDGVQYYFGRHLLPGGTAAQATNSAWTVRVYGPHSGDPCYDAGGFAQSSCTQAWRWNLDYVEDPHGNAAAYYYSTETNYYGADKGTAPVSYIRGGYLDRIDYGIRSDSGSIYGSSAPQRITFGRTERCTVTSTFDCAAAKFTAANASHWPDTPQDQQCASTGTCNNHAPTMWVRQRLSSITTAYYTGSTYATIDSYTLGSSFPTAGDPSLSLDSITRVGHQGSSTITLPAVTFGYALMDNRVVGYNNLPGMPFWRLRQVSTETGQIISVSYSGGAGQTGRAKPLCTATTVPSDPSQDTGECFPVKWAPDYYGDPILDYFHKYVVTEVDDQDRNATAPTRITTYTYSGDPAWHFDDNEVVKPKDRTYGQYRGYQVVYARQGSPTATSNGIPDGWTLTRSLYLRGMDGDQLPSGTRSVDVTNSLGVTVPDSDQLRDTPIETRTFVGDTTTVASTTTTRQAVIATGAVRNRTGLPDLTAQIVRTAESHDYTELAAGGTISTTTVTTYDSLGRELRRNETGTSVAPRCTETHYADSATSRIHAAVSEVIVSAQACPAAGTALSPIVRDTRTYYDGSSTLGAAPTHGDATRVDIATDATHFAKKTATFDDYGRPLSSTTYADASTPRTTTTEYSPAVGGPLTGTTATNPLGQTSSTVLDPGRGSVTRSVDVAGHPTDVTYDALGRTTAVWQPGQVKGTNPATTTFTYLLTPTAPLAVTSKTLVDPGNGAAAGYITTTSISDAFGAVRQTQTDTIGSGRLVTDSFTDSHGWVVRTNNGWYTSGAPGTMLITTADSGINSRTLIAHDGMGRATVSTEYKGTTAMWSTKTVYGGDRTTVFPPTGGVVTTSVTDARGEPTELDRWSTPPTVAGNVISGGTAQRTTYHYDALGQRDQLATGGTTWVAHFDLAGRVTTKDDPDAGESTSTYNDAGDVLTSTDAGNHTLAYTYDALGRKTAEYSGSTSGTKLAAWTYDTLQAGQRTSATRWVNGTAYTVAATGYDAAGNSLGSKISLTEPGFLSSYTTATAWTSTHLMTKQTLADSTVTGGGLPAEPINYFYDKFGHPTGTTGVNAYVSAATYTEFGEPSQYTLGVNNSASWLSFTRDPQTRRIVNVNLSGKTAPPQLENIAYTYDPAGNLTRSVDTQGGAGVGAPVATQCYDYDNLDQLTEAWSATDNCAAAPTASNVAGPQSFWTTWTIDGAGNRTKQVQHQVPGSSTPDTTTTYTMATAGHAHAVSGTSTSGGTASTSYGYDANGNMTTRTTPATGTQTIAYDEHDLIKSVSSPTNSVSYVHDADGNQLLRRDADSTTLFLPGQEITRSSSGTVSVTRYYAHGGMVVAERIDRGNPIYLMSDLHGTNQVAYRPDTGKVTRRYLDPYGNPLGAVTGGPWPDTHAFLDKPTDASTGLTDVGAREYDSTLGRFISVDPVLEADSPGQLNGYSYGSNNPVGNADPTGLMHPKEEEPHGPPTPPASTHHPTPTHTPTHHSTPTKPSKPTSDGPGSLCWLSHLCPPEPSGPRHHLDPCKGHRDCGDPDNPHHYTAPRCDRWCSMFAPVPEPRPVVMLGELPVPCTGDDRHANISCGLAVTDGIEGTNRGAEAANSAKGAHLGERSSSKVIGKVGKVAGKALNAAAWKLTYDDEREEGADRRDAAIVATTTTAGAVMGADVLAEMGATMGAMVPVPGLDVVTTAVGGFAGSIGGGWLGGEIGKSIGHMITYAF